MSCIILNVTGAVATGVSYDIVRQYLMFDGSFDNNLNLAVTLIYRRNFKLMQYHIFLLQLVNLLNFWFSA